MQVRYIGRLRRARPRGLVRDLRVRGPRHDRRRRARAAHPGASLPGPGGRQRRGGADRRGHRRPPRRPRRRRRPCGGGWPGCRARRSRRWRGWSTACTAGRASSCCRSSPSPTPASCSTPSPSTRPRRRRSRSPWGSAWWSARPLGLTLGAALAVGLGLSALPRRRALGATWSASGRSPASASRSRCSSPALAYADPDLVDASKIGVLGGSVVAAVLGFVLLATAARRDRVSPGAPRPGPSPPSLKLS